MAGVLPSSITNRLFKDFSLQTYTPSTSGEEKVIEISTGLWLAVIRFYGNSNEHSSVYLLNYGSRYSKDITTLYSYNYNSNTSFTITANDPGVNGYTLIANYTSINSDVHVYLYKLIL